MTSQNAKKSGSSWSILNVRNFPVAGVATAMLLAGILGGCNKSDVTDPSTTDPLPMDMKMLTTHTFNRVILVSDADEYVPDFIDAHLVNAWGLAFNDEGEAWVNAADQGVSAVYDANGTTLMAPVGIQFDGSPTGGSPTGIVYNSTNTFMIPAKGEKSEFIFASETGTISAWSSGSTANTMVDRAFLGSVYKGLEMAQSGGNNYLYATDFKNGKIDVFNSSFQFQTTGFSFTDPGMEAGYAPFNIKLLGGELYVTYAKQLAPDNMDDDPGPGNGFVDVYNTDGSFVKRFASHGTLNSPWGLEQSAGPDQAIIVGNFGDGRISLFDPSGSFAEYLKSGGDPVVIDGLWSIVLPQDNVSTDDRMRLYFTAGPDDESHGIYGYLAPAL